MKQMMFVVLLLVLCTQTAITQTQKIEGKAPKELADQLWTIATRGELLSQRGWNDASERFFAKPIPFPGTKTIRVVSNS